MIGQQAPITKTLMMMEGGRTASENKRDDNRILFVRIGIYFCFSVFGGGGVGVSSAYPQQYYSSIRISSGRIFPGILHVTSRVVRFGGSTSVP